MSIVPNVHWKIKRVWTRIGKFKLEYSKILCRIGFRKLQLPSNSFKHNRAGITGRRFIQSILRYRRKITIDEIFACCFSYCEFYVSCLRILVMIRVCSLCKTKFNFYAIRLKYINTYVIVSSTVQSAPRTFCYYFIDTRKTRQC